MRLSFNKKRPIGHFTSIWNERLLMVIAARLLAYKVAADVAPAVDKKTLYDTTGKVVYGWNQLTFSSSRAVQSVNSYKKMLEVDHNTYQQGRHRGSMCKDGTNNLTGVTWGVALVWGDVVITFAWTQHPFFQSEVWGAVAGPKLRTTWSPEECGINTVTFTFKKVEIFSSVSMSCRWYINLLGIILKWHCKFSI